MKRNKLVCVCLAMMALACAVIAGPKVLAAEDGPSSTMVVSPMNQRIVLVPGETYEGSIKISNPLSSTSNLKYFAQIGSFSQGDDDVADLIAVSNQNQIMDWIELEKEDGIVKPGSTDVLKFKVVVPKNAPAGGQYATILLENKSDANVAENGGNTTIMEVAQIATIIYAQVAGEAMEKAQILENTIPTFLLNGTLQASAVVENSGNIHTDAKYVLQVWPMGSDEEVCTNEENIKEGLVMPGTKKYHTESCTLPSPGIYKAKQTVKIFGEVSEVEATVVYCPIWLMLVIIFGIAMIVIWIVASTKGRKKKSTRTEAKKDPEEKTDKDE